MGRSLRFAVAALVALLAVNAVLFVVQPGLALPQALGNYLFGPKLVRADVVVFENGADRVLRVDRGRVLTAAGNVLRIYERDGTIVPITVAPDAAITYNGRGIRFERLRRGMRVTTVREGDGPASVVEAGG